MKTTALVLFVTAAIFLIDGFSCVAEETNVVVKGKVKSVSMETSQVEINMATATITENANASVSLVNIQIAERPNETFKIPVDDIVELPPFQDLKGRHKMLGGLLILNPLQSKLIGKDVVLSCFKTKGDSKDLTYLIRRVEVAGFTSDGEPRFNGQIAFSNDSDATIAINGIAGFTEEVSSGPIKAGGTQIVFNNPANIPAKVTITWTDTEGSRKAIVDLDGVRKVGKSGTIAFILGKDHSWKVDLR
jgi:hypothetical protein